MKESSQSVTRQKTALNVIVIVTALFDFVRNKWIIYSALS